MLDDAIDFLPPISGKNNSLLANLNMWCSSSEERRVECTQITRVEDVISDMLR